MAASPPQRTSRIVDVALGALTPTSGPGGRLNGLKDLEGGHGVVGVRLRRRSHANSGTTLRLPPGLPPGSHHEGSNVSENPRIDDPVGESLSFAGLRNE